MNYRLYLIIITYTCVSLLLWIYLIFSRVLGLSKNDCRARVTFLCTFSHLASVFAMLLTGFCLTRDPVLCFLSPYSPEFFVWLSWHFWEAFLCLIFFGLRLWVFGTVSNVPTSFCLIRVWGPCGCLKMMPKSISWFWSHVQVMSLGSDSLWRLSSWEI